MKKSRIVLVALAILMVFAAVSCIGPHVHNYENPYVENGEVFHACWCGDVEKVEGAVAVGIEEDLKKAIVDGIENIYLSADIDLHEGLVIDKSINLDLNGKKLENVVALDSHDEFYTVLSIVDEASLTLKNGTLKAMDNDCYAINVKNGELVVESGRIIGNVSAIQVQKGNLRILGGEFSIVQKWPTTSDPLGTLYTINCIDSNYKDGTAVVSIEGGTFANFNPADCAAEGEHTNFLADGYRTTSKDVDGITWWTVEKN